jgi:hypothetical protein
VKTSSRSARFTSRTSGTPRWKRPASSRRS